MERARSSAVEPVPSTPLEVGGSTRTFEELFADEHQQLFRALYLMTGSTQEAEELMQDAFLRVWERWDRVRDMENPGGYLCRTAVNAARSRSRRLARAAGRTIAPVAPEDPFAATDLRDELVRALAGLSRRQRMALVLTDLMDLPADQAGDLLGIAPATVRSLASQGRAVLRTSMEDDDA